MVQDLNKRKLIDELVENLFIENEKGNSDADTEGLSDDQDFIMDYKINSNVSMTLTFVFPQIYLKAIEILDLKKTVIYQYIGDHLDEADAQFQFGKTKGDYLVIVEEKEGPNPMVNLDQWYCSCLRYAEDFEGAIMEDIQESTTQLYHQGYGYRAGLNSQFKNQLDNAHDVPICEHLLAQYILCQHHDNLQHNYTLKTVDLPQWLAIHSTLLQPPTQ